MFSPAIHDDFAFSSPDTSRFLLSCSCPLGPVEHNGNSVSNNDGDDDDDDDDEKRWKEVLESEGDMFLFWFTRLLTYRSHQWRYFSHALDCLRAAVFVLTSQVIYLHFSSLTNGLNTSFSFCNLPASLGSVPSFGLRWLVFVNILCLTSVALDFGDAHPHRTCLAEYCQRPGSHAWSGRP